MPWRIYCRGLNNLVETFVANGWPKNQHGYKSGRGVHTAWNHILGSILKAKYIVEFDFSGFFNTVKIEAVGDILYQFNFPKFMIAYLVTLSSGDINNIDTKEMRKLVQTKDPTKQGWAQA